MNIDLVTILLWPMGGAHLVISGVLALAGPIGWFVGLIHLAVAAVWILTEPLQGNVPPVRRWWNKRVRA